MVKKISSGGFSIVFIIKEKKSGHQFAAKTFLIKAKDVDQMKKFYKEVEFLNIISKSNPPFVIRYNGYS